MKIISKIILYAIIIALLGAIVYKAFFSKNQQTAAAGLQREPLPVDMLVAKPEAFVQKIELTGTIEANEALVLKSEVSGKVTNIFFQEGQHVKAGQLLIKVYDNDLQAQLKKAQANLSLSKDIEARQKQLLEREAISLQEYNQAEANLLAAQADVDLLAAQISKTEIKAPFDGRIGFRHISPGEYVTPGIDIASIVNDNPAKILFSVPEKYASLITQNTKILFQIEGDITPREAVVFAIDPAIDRSTRTLQLKAKAENSAGLLIPGAFAKIDLILNAIDSAILIPSQALLSEAAGQKVYLFKDQKISPVYVQTSTRTNDRVLITSGIEPGDTVITSGMMQINPRTEVKPAKIL